MYMTNFINKIDKKYIQRDQFYQFKNLRGLFVIKPNSKE